MTAPRSTCCWYSLNQGCFACLSATATPPMAWLWGPPWIEGSQNFCNKCCKQEAVIYVPAVQGKQRCLFSVRSHTSLDCLSYPRLFDPGGKRSCQTCQKQVLLSFVQHYFFHSIPDTPETLVCGGCDNISIVKRGRDNSTGNQARYVSHVCSSSIRHRNYQVHTESIQNHLQAVLHWLHHKSV